MAATASQIKAIESKLSGSKISRSKSYPMNGYVLVYCMTEDGPMSFTMIYSWQHTKWNIGGTGVADESRLAPKA